MIYRRLSKRQKLAMLWWQQPRFRGRDVLLCDGSIRSGKTVCMTVGFILWSMATFNGERFALCGKTIESLRRNVVLNLRDWVPPELTIVERRSENKLIISDGLGRENTYFLFGGRDESSYMLIQGITLAGALLDEVVLMPRSFVEQALARCSIKGSKIWFNCNPEGPEHWFYKNWIEGDNPKKMNALHLHFTMDDNPALAPEVRARYERQFSGVFYDRYILGLWVVAEGLIYTMFNRDFHVVPDKPRPYERYYISVDYGTANPTSMGLWADPHAREKQGPAHRFFCGCRDTRERGEREMVNFNLRGDCIGRTDTDFRRGMTDKRFLELEITAWLRSPERKRQLAGEMYYDKVFAPFGISYEKKSQQSLSPTDEELAKGENWCLVHSGESDEGQRSYVADKAVPIARILSRG